LGQNVANVYSGVPAAIDIELQTAESEAEEAREILKANAEENQGLGEDEDFDEDEPGLGEEGQEEEQE
jgi:hypothetical protein